MRISWLHPLWHRNPAACSSAAADAWGRWRFIRRKRGGDERTPPAANLADSTDTAALPPVPDRAHASHRVELPLPHHVDVSHASECLLRHLDCTAWHVVCHHDHQWIVHLTRGECPKYAVCYECTPAVEKGICHGSRAWAMTLIPLHSEADVPANKVTEIEAELANVR